MTAPLLSRGALARVLQSLLTAELNKTRRPSSEPWPEHLVLGDDGVGSLGCDSLEMLGLAAATNEMFRLYEARLDAEVYLGRTFGEWLNTIEAAWRAGVSRVTFKTSGSTGIPKRCTHAFSMLETEVHFLAERFSTGKRIVELAPAHHIYGFLFTGMLPDRLGAEVVGYSFAGSAALRLRPNDLVVSVPEGWEFLNCTVTDWPEQVDGVVSTAPCARELIDALIDNGLRSMTEIYGSTETAGVGTRRWPGERYSLMPQWSPRKSAAGDRIQLLHFSGIRVDPMDDLHWEENGSFTIAGRHDGAVQVGGTNVYPARIAELLAEQPGVADAAVSLSKLEGRLNAFIVLEGGTSSELVRRDLEIWMQQHLVAVERPKSLAFVAALPTAT